MRYTWTWALTAALMLAGAGQAGAVMRWWAGPPSGNWFTSTHWNPVGAPASSDDLVVLSGSPLTGSSIAASNGGSIFLDGSSTSLTLSGTGSLEIGFFGYGSMTVQNQATVHSYCGYLAWGDPESATVVVDGNNSSWDTDIDIYVGYGGTAHLEIMNGGSVECEWGAIGNFATADGMVTIYGGMGYNSYFTCRSSLAIGGNDMGAGGAGRLNALAGGYVDCGDILRVWAGGTLYLDGGQVDTDSIYLASGSTLDPRDGALNIDGGTVVIDDQAITWDGTGDPILSLKNGINTTLTGIVMIAENNNGTMNIESGSQLTNSYGKIGEWGTSHGVVNVRGSGSNWHNTFSTVVGRYGDGELNITSSGRVDTDRDGVLGESGGSGTVLVDDGTWDIDRDLIVGKYAEGDVTVQNGGTVTCGNECRVGNLTGSDGYVKVTGAGSSMMISGPLYVAGDGVGVVDVLAGADLMNTTAYVGHWTGTSGTVNVDGNPSTWTNTGTLYVGYNCNGYANITAGGQASNTSAYLGYSTGVTGEVTVNGSGSDWTSTGVVTVGRSGSGWAKVQAGATASSGTVYIARLANSSGRVDVTDAGSTWTCSGSVYIAGTDTVASAGATGTLNVTNGGVMDLRDGKLKIWSGGNVSGTGTIIADEVEVVPGASYSFRWLRVNTLTGFGNAVNLGGCFVQLGHTGGAASGSHTVGAGQTFYTEQFWAGYDAPGTLTVSGGGDLTDYNVHMSEYSGANGSALTVTGAGSTLSVQNQLNVGRRGTASMTISDGASVSSSYANIPYYATGTGNVTVEDAATTWTANTIHVGHRGSGFVDQTGGTVSASVELAIGFYDNGTGTYTISGGSLTAKDLRVSVEGTGTFEIDSASADVTVTNELSFGPYSTFNAVPGATIHMTGSHFRNACTDPAALSGLADLTLIFEGGHGDRDDVEVAGIDYGAVAAGWVNNFVLDTLQIGGAAPGWIRLVDDVTNQLPSDDVEAMYVNWLVLNSLTKIEPNSLHLYYLNGLAPKQFYLGDANLDGLVDLLDLVKLANNWSGSGKLWDEGDFNGDGNVDLMDLTILANNWNPGGSAVPEPATLALLAIGGLVFLRRKRGFGG